MGKRKAKTVYIRVDLPGEYIVFIPSLNSRKIVRAIKIRRYYYIRIQIPRIDLGKIIVLPRDLELF